MWGHVRVFGVIVDHCGLFWRYRGHRNGAEISNGAFWRSQGSPKGPPDRPSRPFGQMLVKIWGNAGCMLGPKTMSNSKPNKGRFLVMVVFVVGLGSMLVSSFLYVGCMNAIGHETLNPVLLSTVQFSCTILKALGGRRM